MAMQALDGKRYMNGSTLAQMLERGPIRRRAARVGITVRPMEDVALGPGLLARFNHNYWIVDCPDCGSAEFVWIDEPVMLCQKCWNAVVDGRWRRVVVPGQWRQIERIMRVRINPDNRNWYPGESLAKLKAENMEHGRPEGVD